MYGYFGYFLDGPGQIVAFAAAAAVWIGFCAIGAAIAGPGGDRDAGVFYGWAVAAFAFTVIGVFRLAPFTPVAIGLAVAALAAAIHVWRRGGALLAPGSGRMLAVALPLLLLVSAMSASQWDEFADWLMTPRLMLETDAFPDRANQHLSGSLATYPYNWHLMTYLASRVSGHMLENAGALFNLFLLLAFALHLARMMNDDRGEAPPWALCALGALLAIPFNPTFAQKVALTSYADTSSAVAVGFAALLGWRMLGGLAAGDKARAQGLARQMGLVLMVLVNLKQATFVLFVLVVSAVLLAGLRDPKVRIRDLLARVPVMVVPAIGMFMLWRGYVGAEMMVSEFTIRPFAGWLIADLPEILSSMVAVLARKGLYLALLLAVSGFALRALIRIRTPFDRLALIAGAVMLGYNAFLLFSYLAAFGRLEALRAASMWRYNMHLGPLAIAFMVYGAGQWWRRRPRSVTALAAALPVALMVAAPLALAYKVRFDLAQPVRHYRVVAAELTGLLKPGDSLSVLDPKGTGESGIIARYELGSTGIFKNYIGVFQKPTVENLTEHLAHGGYSHLLIHSPMPGLNRVLGIPLPAGASVLLAADGHGPWTVVKTWPYPDNFPIH